MLGRMLRSADFELTLSVPAHARSAHFAAHHVARAPSRPDWPARKAGSGKLSTAAPEACTQPVDERIAAGPDRCWFGMVVPKRHARKATTRNLLRRQIRAAMDRHHAGLAHGLWLVRLRAPFDTKRYVSGSSATLGTAARLELDVLLSRAAA